MGKGWCLVLGGVLVACGAKQSAGPSAGPPPRASASAPAVPSSAPSAKVASPPPRLAAEVLAFVPKKLDRVTAAKPSPKPSGQTYALPIPKAALVNLQRDVLTPQLLRDKSPELRRLLERGMTIAPSEFRRFDLAYARLRELNVPVLVTADSVLHQQHILFNEILKASEQRTLAPMLKALVVGLNGELLGRLKQGESSEPLLNELAVTSVARKLLDPKFEPDAAVKARVEADLKSMTKHQGQELAHAQSSARCIESGGMTGRCYHEDFSQYVPRGHYTTSEELGAYFRASMWLGRIGRRLKYPEEIQQQVWLIDATQRARCQYAGRELPAIELLSQIDQLLQFFIGVSDDLTLPEVDTVLHRALDVGSDLRLSGAAARQLQAQLRKLRAPRILSGSVDDYGNDAAATIKDESQGLRLLGQRFAADSEVLGGLVFEAVGPNPSHPRYAEVAKDAVIDRNDYCDQLDPAVRQSLATLDRSVKSPKPWRCVCERSLTLMQQKPSSHEEEQSNRALSQVCRLMPSGLDVAAAMGSQLAADYLKPSGKYLFYEQELARLRGLQQAAAAVAPESLYQEWLTALHPLLAPLPNGYPTWMTGQDYRKKSLRTFLASWTELRQDTLLYVKQSYTAHRFVLESGTVGPERPLPPEAYGVVEAQPELYASLKALIENTRGVLRQLGGFPPEVEKSLSDTEAVLSRLTQISTQQLQGKGLTADDEQYIKLLGDVLLRISLDLTRALTPPPPPGPPKLGPYGEPLVAGSQAQNLDEALLVPMIADVHTDLNTSRVLEEGTGPLEWMVAVTRLPDGKLSVAVGPIFSYKEFVHPLNDRLPNERWRGELGAGGPLPAPAWWSSDRALSNGFELPSLKRAP